jgi:hypothetical protein
MAKRKRQQASAPAVAEAPPRRVSEGLHLQLTVHGIPPYRLAYDMKWPGTYAATVASIMGVFGETISGIR